ncbi:MAG: acyltransferase [Planctomycetia bacterium]
MHGNDRQAPIMTAVDPMAPTVIGQQADLAIRLPLPLLTSLRFFEAVDVIVYHRAPSQAPGFLANLAASGYDAVSFFFILSGFILAYVYHAPTTPSKMKSSTRTFWTARLARIMPTYLLGLLPGAPLFAYSSLVSRVIPLDHGIAGLVLVPTLLQAWWPPTALVWNGPAWSLSVEAFFYALFPWLMRLISGWSNLRGIVFAMALIIAASVIRAFIPSADATSMFRTNFVLYWPLFHLPSFILGMTLGRWFLEQDCRRNGIFSWLFPAGAITTVLLFGCRSWLPTWGTSPPIQTLAFSILIIGAAAARPTGFLARPTFVALGESSYAMYILHEPVAFWWNRFIGGIGEERTWTAFTGFLVTVITGAVAVYFWFEKPCQRRLLRQTPRSVTPSAPVLHK